jgi:hypothetical protein
VGNRLFIGGQTLHKIEVSLKFGFYTAIYWIFHCAQTHRQALNHSGTRMYDSMCAAIDLIQTAQNCQAAIVQGYWICVMHVALLSKIVFVVGLSIF